MITLKMGDMMKPCRIERYKGSKNVIDVLNIVTRNISGGNFVFYDGVGYIEHWDSMPEDLLNGKAPSQYYIIPAIRYHINKMPNDYGVPLSIVYIRASQSLYDTLMSKEEMKGDITKYDLAIRCTDETYQKLEIELLGPPRWKQDETMKNVVRELYGQYKSLINVSICRTLVGTDAEKEVKLRQMIADATTRLAQIQAPASRTALPQQSRALAVTKQEDTFEEFDDLVGEEEAGGVIDVTSSEVIEDDLEQEPQKPVAVVKPVAAAPKPVAKPVATAPKPVAKPVVAPKPVVKPTPKPVEAVVVEEEGDEVADGAVADDDLDALLGD